MSKQRLLECCGLEPFRIVDTLLDNGARTKLFRIECIGDDCYRMTALYRLLEDAETAWNCGKCSLETYE